jgi:hypothetical protein
MRKLGLILVGMTLGVLAGCASVATPNWGQPGTADAQRRRAERFDPYPETDVGPGGLGVRPRGFEQPLAEPLRARRQ